MKRYVGDPSEFSTIKASESNDDHLSELCKFRYLKNVWGISTRRDQDKYFGRVWVGKFKLLGEKLIKPAVVPNGSEHGGISDQRYSSECSGDVAALLEVTIHVKRDCGTSTVSSNEDPSIESPS